MNDLNALTGLVRRCVEDYDMIAPGDTVAVGVSGGKDSLVLLMALNELRRYYPKPFTLEAITVELGFDGMDFAPVAELLAKFQAQGGRIGLCASCMAHFGITAEQVIPGCEVITAGDVVDLLTAAKGSFQVT